MDRPNLYSFFENLPPEIRYVALGDTNHLNPDVDALKGDFDLYRAASNAGFGAFVQEKSPENMTYNNIIAAVIETTDEDPETYFNDTVAQGSKPDEIVGAFAAAAFEMTAIYPDPRYSPEFTMAITAVYGVMQDVPIEICQGVVFSAYMNQNPDIEKAIENGIGGADATIAERIEAQSEGDRTLIVYGNGHFSGLNDLNEMLGEQQVVHIAAIGSRDVGYNPDSSGKLDEPDYPDYIYVANEDAVIPFDLDDPEIQVILANFESRNYDEIPRDEYLECLGELPEDLKAHAPERDDVKEEERVQALYSPPLPGQSQ